MLTKIQANFVTINCTFLSGLQLLLLFILMRRKTWDIPGKHRVSSPGSMTYRVNESDRPIATSSSMAMTYRE